MSGLEDLFFLPNFLSSQIAEQPQEWHHSHPQLCLLSQQITPWLIPLNLENHQPLL